VPEGDSILWAATRIRPVLAGRLPDSTDTPDPRAGGGRWPKRLADLLVPGCQR
jgi:endonuclease VIII